MLGVMIANPEEAPRWVPRLATLDTVRLVSDMEPVSPSVTAWVVVLPRSMAPALLRFWFRQVTAPLLLITPHVAAGLVAVQTLSVPVLVADPDDAARTLPALVDALRSLTHGHARWSPAETFQGTAQWMSF